MANPDNPAGLLRYWLEEEYGSYPNESEPLLKATCHILELEYLRGTWAKSDAYPNHPSASLAISVGPLPAKVAYHAWKGLGAGVSSPPALAIPGGPLEAASW